MTFRAMALQAPILSCAIVSWGLSTVSAADVPECPSFKQLGQRVDAKVHEILALRPGMPLKEFTSKHASQGLNFWDDVGAERERLLCRCWRG